MSGRQYTISIKLAPERLLYAGPLIPGAWRHTRDEAEAGSVGGEVLIDTGAFGAMIDLDVAIVYGYRYWAQKKFMEFTATAQFAAIKQSLSFRRRISWEKTVNLQQLLNA